LFKMKKEFSKSWNTSKQPRKQRKFRINAPLHLRHSFLSAHLDKELRKKYNKRSMPVRKGDKVKIVRGSFKGKIGKVESVDVKASRVFVEKVEMLKKDGSKSAVPIAASNVILLELSLDDRERKKILERVKK